MARYYNSIGDYYKEVEFLLKARKIKKKKENIDLPIPEVSLFQKIIMHFPQSCKYERNEIEKYNKATGQVNEKIAKNNDDAELFLIKNELAIRQQNFKKNMSNFCKIIIKN